MSTHIVVMEKHQNVVTKLFQALDDVLIMILS